VPHSFGDIAMAKHGETFADLAFSAGIANLQVLDNKRTDGQGEILL
jgi:hypothetical protein